MVRAALRFSACPGSTLAAIAVIRGSGKTICSHTGLAVPECSCKDCFEAMLRRFHPALLDGSIKITRTATDPKRSKA
jgi:hypothetical protein